jgi:hypothetical protein
MHGVHAQNYHIMTPALGKDWALAWGCNSYVKNLPYANAAYREYAGCEGPQRAVEIGAGGEQTDWPFLGCSRLRQRRQ